MTYCGLTSCTVLLAPCWSLGEGREDGEGTGDGEGRWVEEEEEEEEGKRGGVEGIGLKSQVPEEVPGLHRSDSRPCVRHTFI